LITAPVLLWRDVGSGRWEFYAAALHDGALGYPAAAVRAHTTDEILDVIRGISAPETATAPPAPVPQPGSLPTPLTLAVVFVATFLIITRRAAVRASSSGA
jgi:hypothetical protein